MPEAVFLSICDFRRRILRVERMGGLVGGFEELCVRGCGSGNVVVMGRTFSSWETIGRQNEHVFRGLREC